MPPRKSDASKVATADEATPAKDQTAARDGINIEDLNLPKSVVTRLAKGVLPPNTQIQANATLAITKSATVFVNYLAAHANEHASASNRKTIAPQDVFNALEDLEFSHFRNRLEAELAKFNEVQADKRNAYRSKVAHKAADAGEAGEDDGPEDRDGRPAAKKARLEGGEASAGDGEVDADETLDADQTEDEDDAQEEDDDEGDDEQLEADEQLEDTEQKEAEDEALDNGEDSD